MRFTGGEWRFINGQGGYAFGGTFEEAGDFGEGLAPVMRKGKWGFVDKTGALVIPTRLDDATGFTEGRARIGVDDGSRRLFGFIDKKGNVVVQPQFVKAGRFSGGLAHVAKAIGPWTPGLRVR
ncbi:MAG: WG repeat-containing protein, partial [bacterium]|nr:WG repeat-containing protein [bacterium]